MAKLTEDFLREELKTKSIRQIAAEQNTYPNKIGRLAKKFNIEIPSQAEGQKRSYASGRSVPPMLGKKHNHDSLNKISQSRHTAWEEQKNSPEYEELIKKYKDAYDSRSDEEKDAMQRMAAKAIYQTRTQGSKLERFLLEKLRDAGYSPEFHAKQVILQEDLEVDIYIGELSIALEVDGVTHDENIYGEDHLARRRLADSKKNGLLLMNGFTIIRIPNKVKHVSQYFLESTWLALRKELDRIIEEKPEPSVIHLEVN